MKFWFCGFIDRLVSYAACLEGSDPVRLLEKRLNMRRGDNYFLSI